MAHLLHTTGDTYTPSLILVLIKNRFPEEDVLFIFVILAKNKLFMKYFLHVFAENPLLNGFPMCETITKLTRYF